MPKIGRLLLPSVSVATLLASAAWSQPVAMPSDAWAQSGSDIPADSAVRFGVLQNGMKYAILRNGTPLKRASLRLRIDAGSLMETNTQLGLAHFMEHMTYKGSVNMPGDELVRIQERLGMKFGKDSNAITTYDQTVYSLDLPNVDDTTVDTSLRTLREQVSQLLLIPDAINKERGVVESEMRSRDTPESRSLNAQLGFLAPRQRLSQRSPIGDLNTIRTSPRERIVEFYDAYYRPSRATLVAVGDIDPDVLETKVRRFFGDWEPRSPDGPEPDLGIVASRRPEIKILVEPGVQSSVQMSWIRNPDRVPDNTMNRRRAIVENLAAAIFNRRLDKLSRIQDPPFISAGVSASNMYDSFYVASVEASFAAGSWKRALETIEQETRSILRFGVSSTELKREIEAARSSMEAAVTNAATRTTPALAGALVRAANDRKVFTSPQVDLDIFEAATQNLMQSHIDDALKSMFRGEGPLTLVITPTEIAGGDATVAAALENSGKSPVAGTAVEGTIRWPYDDFGDAGTVVKRTEIAQIGATVVTFANDMKLTIKPTRFRNNQILVSVRIGNGERGLPTDHLTPFSLGAQAFISGGLGQLTFDQIGKALNGRQYSIAAVVDEDAFVLKGETRHSDLASQLQLMAAYVVDPGMVSPLSKARLLGSVHS